MGVPGGVHKFGEGSPPACARMGRIGAPSPTRGMGSERSGQKANPRASAGAGAVRHLPEAERLDRARDLD